MTIINKDKSQGRTGLPAITEGAPLAELEALLQGSQRPRASQPFALGG